MQVITKDRLICYVFEDSEIIEIQNDITIVGDPIVLYISDINTQNGALYKNVTLPEDWDLNKYMFDGDNWTINPDYIPPTPQPTTTGTQTI